MALALKTRRRIPAIVSRSLVSPVYVNSYRVFVSNAIHPTVSNNSPFGSMLYFMLITRCSDTSGRPDRGLVNAMWRMLGHFISRASRASRTLLHLFTFAW
jgi:hypothetical protein